VQEDKDIVGRRINFRGLTYAPVNEQGVVLLFGMICEQLGIIVEGIRQGYPDAIGIDYRGERHRGVRKSIEFEYFSANFSRQQHDPSKCDILVCWNHDWKTSPSNLEIIELKKEIEEMGQTERIVAEGSSKFSKRKSSPLQKRSVTREATPPGSRLSGWEAHKRMLPNARAVERRIEEARTRGVSQGYIKFLGRLKRYWEIREGKSIAR
jgi:hypothetical protein